MRISQAQSLYRKLPECHVGQLPHDIFLLHSRICFEDRTCHRKNLGTQQLEQHLLEIPHHSLETYIFYTSSTKKYLILSSHSSLFFKAFQAGLDPRNPKTPPAIVVMLQEVEDNVHRWIPDVTCPVVPIHLQTWWSTGRLGAYHREVFRRKNMYVKYSNYRKNTWRTQTCMSFLFQFAALLHLLFPVCSGPWSFLSAYGLHLITHPIHAYHV